MVYQSFLHEVSSRASSSQCLPAASCVLARLPWKWRPKAQMVSAVMCHSHGTWLYPPFLSCCFSSPLHRCYFLKGLTWTWQIVSWFTLMFLYNMWGISVALERCSKKPCSFSKELQIANSLKAVRNPTFFWSLGASTISIYFECCQGAASAFYSVIVLQNAE